MKITSAFLGIMLLVACDRKPHTDRDDLTTEWSHDGNSMMVMRKGVPIATFRNLSNVCFIELTGTDGLPDVSASYYEDESTELAPAPENIHLGWIQAGGALKTAGFDRNGDLLTPTKKPEKK